MFTIKQNLNRFHICNNRTYPRSKPSTRISSSFVSIFTDGVVLSSSSNLPSNRLAFAVAGFASEVIISVFTPFGVSVVIVTFTMLLTDGADRTSKDDEFLLVVVIDGLFVVLEFDDTVDELDAIVEAVLMHSVFTSTLSPTAFASIDDGFGLVTSSLMNSSVFTNSFGLLSVVLVGKGEAFVSVE